MVYFAAMLRHTLIYGAALAALALAAEALEMGNALGVLPGSLFVLGVALLFAALGVWLGVRLVPRAVPSPFQRNEQALKALGISQRECDVLDLVAEGASNKVIARKLDISPNTVKTHLARLFEKLDAQSRTQLVRNARSLRVLP
ncbi:MAG: response regulator transcription factor [Novosphingobium sp.]